MKEIRVMIRAVWCSAVAATAALAVAAAALPAAAPTQADALRTQLRDIIEGVGWSSARWGVLAVSLDTGDTLYARNAEAPLVPASNLKLFTTAAAIEQLGPDFRYQTLVLADGPVSSGVLRGDLILYGTGDPGLSDRFYETRTTAFEALADQLLAAGIRSVEGDMVGDGSYFSGPLRGRGWNPLDLNDWFTAASSALAFNENMVTLRIEAARTAGARPTIRTLPLNADEPVTNLAITGRGSIKIKRETPNDPILIEGAVPPGGREVWRQMTVSDPSRYAARIFANVLEEKGIRVRGTIRPVNDAAGSRVTGKQLWAPGLREDAPRIIARHRSPPLQEYLEVVNKRSHNLLADMTLKTLGRMASGDGSFAGGGRVVEAYIADELGGDTASVEVHDGSGLSAHNKLAAGDFIRLMDHMSRSHEWEAWWATLPEAGNPQELRRMYRTTAAGNLRAKTGTIENVSALSGMVRSAQGERIAFSIMGNDVPSTWGAKRVEDRIGVHLSSIDRPFEVRTDVRLARGPSAGSPASRRAAAEGDADVTAERSPTVAGERTAAADPGTDTASPGRTTSETTEATAETDEPLRTHRVQSGENLIGIARRYEVTVNDLVAANGGISPRSLQAGADLVIPAGDTAAPAPLEQRDPERHEVRPGENFTVIARRYGVSLNALLEANPGVTPRSLQAGQMIEIPASEGNDG